MVKRQFILAAALALLTFSASAQEGRVAFVNFERVYQESKVVIAVRDKINAKFKEREESLQEQNEELRAMQEELAKEELTLSETQKEARRSEIEQLGRQFERARRALLEDRGVMLQEQRRELDVKIAEVIENIAREQKYAMVLNPYLTLPVSGNRTLTHNILLFADPSADITGEVIARFDEEMELDS